MITNTGKTIIGKYLLGQAPAYASHIAVGCGAQPIATGDPIPDFSGKTNLDFEMFRVPITSRGFVNEDGVAKIVLTAELPTEERYEFTEVGLYSAGSNPAASSNDSRTLFGFTQAEQWEQHFVSNSSSVVTAIPVVAERLDSQEDYNIDYTGTVFQVNADNPTFASAVRSEAYERGRFYNNMILLRGDTSMISNVSGIQLEGSSTHVHLTGIRTDFSKNSPVDQLRLAFSLVNKTITTPNAPQSVRLIVEFSSDDLPSTANYAKYFIDLDATDFDFLNERYFVVSKELQELEMSTTFSWLSVTTAKIYASVLEKFDVRYIDAVGSTDLVTLVLDENPNLSVGDTVYLYSNGNTGTISDTFAGLHTVTNTATVGLEYHVTFSANVAANDFEDYGSVPAQPYIEKNSDSYYVALDAMRFENVNTVSPLYGLTGYSVISNPNMSPVLKNPNTNNYLEFRFALGVQ